MTINWTEFTPLMSLLGGGLIGVAALFMMVTKGRVMGISGILLGLLTPQQNAFELLWRVLFVVGTIAGPVALVHVFGTQLQMVQVADGAVLYLAAFLVGLGTAIGSGCTSGHGICGLSRLSLRSFAAVAVFMTTAILTVLVMRHLI